MELSQKFQEIQKVVTDHVNNANSQKNFCENFKSFMEKLEYNAGVILIFREENIYKLKEQIPQVNGIREKIIIETVCNIILHSP